MVILLFSALLSTRREIKSPKTRRALKGIYIGFEVKARGLEMKARGLHL